MASLTVGNIDDDLVRRLHRRAAEHGRSVEAEHRDILCSALVAEVSVGARQTAVERLAAFRRRTAGRGSAPSAELLAETRGDRLGALSRESC